MTEALKMPEELKGIDGVNSPDGIKLEDGVKRADDVNNNDDVNTSDDVNSNDGINTSDDVNRNDGRNTSDDGNGKERINTSDGVNSDEGGNPSEGRTRPDNGVREPCKKSESGKMVSSVGFDEAPTVRERITDQVSATRAEEISRELPLSSAVFWKSDDCSGGFVTTAAGEGMKTPDRASTVENACGEE